MAYNPGGGYPSYPPQGGAPPGQFPPGQQPYGSQPQGFPGGYNPYAPPGPPQQQFNVDPSSFLTPGSNPWLPYGGT